MPKEMSRYNYKKPVNIRFRIIRKVDCNDDEEFWIYRKNWFSRWMRIDFFNSYESNGFSTLEEAIHYLNKHHKGPKIEEVVHEQ